MGIPKVVEDTENVKGETERGHRMVQDSNLLFVVRFMSQKRRELSHLRTHL